MSKFRITKPSGEQFVIETDTSHSVLLAEYGPSTDIQPIVESAPVVEEEAPKPKRKAKVAEE